jgi:hypothetical protein
MDPRKYSLITIGITILGLATVALVNAVVDPYGQYRTGWFKPIVQDSRAEKLALFNQLEKAPDGLILGSSRVLKFEPAYLKQVTGKTFFNAGVNHARPADFLAWIRCYETRWGVYPKCVVLGVDTAFFDSHPPIDGRVSAEPNLAKHVPEHISLADRWSHWTQLLGFQQCKSSLQSIVRTLRHREPTEPVEYFDSDGRIVYREREAALSQGTYDFEAALKFNQGEFKNIYSDFKDLSRSEAERFVTLIRDLRDHDVEIYLFNTPFHPRLEQSLEAIEYFSLRQDEARKLLSLMAENWQVNAHDLSHIESFGGTEKEFVDGIHPLEVNTRRMIDRLFSNRQQDRYALQ